eukprot:m.276600 g.276600  ORF g.276600 m.276600 type:complete len:465 (+) comp16302_c0_seq7:66-1460(+)
MEVCVICGRAPTFQDSKEGPSLLYCDGKNCSVIVHQACYGVVNLPPGQQKWYCKRCEPHSTIRATKMKCCLCPRKQGALKCTTKSEEFCHVICALWQPEAVFVNQAQLEPIDLSGVNLSKGVCVLCQHRESSSLGFRRECDAHSCERYVHVSCAQEKQLLSAPFGKNGLMDLSDRSKFLLFCDLHSNEVHSTSLPSKKSSRLKSSISPSGSASKLKVKDAVQAFWKSGKKLYEGFIESINGDGTVNIRYRDGDFEENVKQDLVRPLFPKKEKSTSKTNPVDNSQDSKSSDKMKETKKSDKKRRDSNQPDLPAPKTAKRKDDSLAERQGKKSKPHGKDTAKPPQTADKFCETMSRLLKQEQKALLQLAFHDNFTLSGVDMQALSRLEQAKSNTDRLKAKIEKDQQELNSAQDVKRHLETSSDPSFDSDANLSETLAFIFGKSNSETISRQHVNKLTQTVTDIVGK